MHRSTRIFLFLIATITSIHASPVILVTADNVGALVRSQNPGLAAARLAIDEAASRMSGAGLLENPELEINTRTNHHLDEGGFEIGISQKFPATARLRTQKDQAATAIRAAEAEVREVANQTIGEARALVFRILAIGERERLLASQQQLAEELAGFVANSAQQGEASVIELSQARMEALQGVVTQRQLAAERQRILGQLQGLIGLESTSTMQVTGNLPPLRIPAGADTSNRPSIEIARLAVLHAEQEAAIERTKRRGDITAGAFVGAERKIDRPDGGENEAILGLRVSIPLPFWDKNEANIAAAEAKAARLRAQVAAVNRSTHIEAEAARAEMLEWAKLTADISTQLLPMVDEQTRLAEEAWRNGQGDLLSVLRSREKAIELSTSRVDAMLQFHLARARYETTLGNH